MHILARILRLSFTIAVLAALTFAHAGGGSEKPRQDATTGFEQLGQDFLTEHCQKGAATADCDFEHVLAKDYARFELGLFDVAFPASFLDQKVKAEALREIQLGLLDLQARWIDWVGLAEDGQAKAQADLSKLRAWVKALKPAQLASFPRAEDKDWIACLAPDPEIVGAAQGLRAYLCSAESAALVPSEGKCVRLVLSPTRLDFMRLLGYGGLIDQTARSINWTASAVEWTQFWLGWNLCLALEYSPWEGNHPEFKIGMPMSKFGPTVMVQHVVQQSTLALLYHCNPTLAEDNFDRGLAAHMTIEVCGEINTIENSGSIYSSGAETQPYERFVPGGNPNGGTLPAQEADSLDAIVENHWRKGHGKDHYLAPLRAGQKDGAKEAKSKDSLVHFLLEAGQAGGKFVVHAPFLGPHAADQAYPPAEYLIDYAEFFRVYRAAFVHWLENRAEASPEESKAKFSRLIASDSKRGVEQSFDEIVEEVYGLPISAKDGSTDSLEWRFLAWIKKGK